MLLCPTPLGSDDYVLRRPDTHMYQFVQLFALRMCTKQKSPNHHSLLSTLDISSLSRRRKHAKLILLKFLNNLSYLPEGLIYPASPSLSPLPL